MVSIWHRTIAAGIAAIALIAAFDAAFQTSGSDGTAEAGEAPELALVAGLNAISFPGEIPGVDTCFELLAYLGGPEVVAAIQQLDAAEQRYEACSYEGAGPTGLDFAIHPGTGYLIEMIAPAAVPLPGVATCPLWDLEAGVNLVGVPSPALGVGCRGLLADLGAQAVASIERFDAGRAGFDACGFDADDVAVGSDFAIGSTDAYFVHAREALRGFNPNDPESPACAGAVCGDGLVNRIEETCDGGDDAACPGECLVDCTCPGCPLPIITSVGPTAGPPGTPVEIEGSGFACGAAPPVLTCGDVELVVLSASDTMLGTVIPPGADDCAIRVTTAGGSTTAPEGFGFDVVPSKDFFVSAAPLVTYVIQGASVEVTVSVDGDDDLAELVTLEAEGLPNGVTANFVPASITRGQSARMILSAAADAPLVYRGITVRAQGRIDGIQTSDTVPVSVRVLGGGRSGITGQFRLLHGPPLPGVLLGVVDQVAETDAGGNFRFLDLPAGKHTMTVDASRAAPQLPIYGIDVEVVAGEITALEPFDICPPPPPERFTPLAQTDPEPQVVEDDRFPGVSFTIPPGVTITGWDGKPKTQMAFEKLNPDELPVPQPPGPTRSLYQPFFGTPSGGLPSAPIPVTLPNDLNLDPGDKAELWYYDAAPFPNMPGQWVRAGLATVSDDGATVSTDPGVGITRFCGVCGLSCLLPSQNDQPNDNPNSPDGGDPVNLFLGQMTVEKTDLVLPGRITAAVHRNYNPFDPFPGIAGFRLSIGAGWALSVEVVLQEETASLRRLILPGNSRIAFTQQSPGTFASETSASFGGAVLTDEGSAGHRLRFRDGTVWRFAPGSGVPGIELLAEQIDRNDNRLVIEHSGNQVSKIIEPAGRELVFSYSGGRLREVRDPIGRTVQYAYDGSNRLQTVTDPAGGTTVYAYDASNRIVSITDPRGITYIRNEYDAAGRVSRQIQADGGEWRFDYLVATACIAVFPVPAACLGTRSVLGTVVTDPRGNPTTYRYDANGATRSIEDALGQVTTFERDAAGRVTRITDSLGRATRFEYDASGQLTAVLDPGGGRTGFSYDSATGALQQILDPAGGVTQIELNARGDAVGLIDNAGYRTTFEYDDLGQLRAIVDPAGNRTTLSYDSFGNMISVRDPLGASTNYGYDAASRRTSITDPRGKTTRFSHDALDRVRSVTDALGGRSEWQYDPNGNLVSVTNARDATTTFDYDVMDRLIRETNPLGHSDQLEYDTMGLLTRRTDRNASVVRLSYDERGQVEELQLSDRALTYRYDAAERLIAATDSITGSISFAYDDLDRIVEQASDAGVVRYEYDSVGRRTAMLATGLLPTLYQYDSRSLLTRVTRGAFTAELEHDAAGRRTRISRSGDIDTRFDYDPASHVTQIAHGALGASLGAVTYAYDAAGNPIAIDGSWGQVELPETVDSASYDHADRQVSFGLRSMNYDANGNLTTIRGGSVETDFVWDSADLLREIRTPSDSLRFYYDALGRRTEKASELGATRYLHDGIEILEELTSNGPIDHLRTLEIDELLLRGDQVVLADALGSTISVLSNSRMVTDRVAYEPFGRTVQTGQTMLPFLFTGREQDLPGLYFFRARYYSPELHRFLSEDPIGLLGGDLNPYVYAFNSPTRFTDPTGEFAIVPFIAAGALLGIAGQAIGDIASGRPFCASNYAGAALGGAAGGIAAFFGAGALAAGAIAGGTGSLSRQLLGGGPLDPGAIAIDTAFGVGFARIPGLRIGGRGGWSHVANTQTGRLLSGATRNISLTTGGKIFASRVAGGLPRSGLRSGVKAGLGLGGGASKGCGR